MRPINYDYFRLLSFVCLCIFIALSLQSCGEESCILPTPDGGYDPVFNADGGFIITYGMLDKRYNEITFPGTHNSYTSWYHYSDWPDPFKGPRCKCQELDQMDQVNLGIRYIEFDINENWNVDHGEWCSDGDDIVYYFIGLRDLASWHPHQVFTIRISDLFHGLTDKPEEAYAGINDKIRVSGLHERVYNWDPTVANEDPRRCYIPNPWPTLREMIESGKNVMFIHSRWGAHDIIDEGGIPDVHDQCGGFCYYCKAYDLESMCKLMRLWDPPRERQRDGPYRLFLAECEPDQYYGGGDRTFAARNNDGRKLYQLTKHQETELLPDDRAVNFIIIDYFAATDAGHLSIDVVDACNRLNYERFGIDWESCEGFWELYPYEFDDSKVEYITQVQSLTDEVEKVIDDFKRVLTLNKHERTGKIVSTPCEIIPDVYANWIRLPEWAVDDDFFTRWCAANVAAGPALGIDLGEPKAIDEIAIAWEYPHIKPGYRVYASNDSRFADGISQDELTYDDDWVLVAESVGEPKLWDQVEFYKDTGTSKWRYVKVKITVPVGEWSSFWELRLYGPAN